MNQGSKSENFLFPISDRKNGDFFAFRFGISAGISDSQIPIGNSGFPIFKAHDINCHAWKMISFKFLEALFRNKLPANIHSHEVAQEWPWCYSMLNHKWQTKVVWMEIIGRICQDQRCKVHSLIPGSPPVGWKLTPRNPGITFWESKRIFCSCLSLKKAHSFWHYAALAKSFISYLNVSCRRVTSRIATRCDSMRL